MEKISFVIPVYNEEENVPRLFEEITRVADGLGRPYEILLVDDCSSDASLEIIKSLTREHPTVKYLSFARNCGQSAALYAGFQAATGDIIITLDADLQNDPGDIPVILQHYGEYDMVNGWRYNRQDTLSKKIGSRIGNFVRNTPDAGIHPRHRLLPQGHERPACSSGSRCTRDCTASCRP